MAASTLTHLSAFARAQQVSLHLERRGEIYAGMPFVLALSAEGFDETPEPKVLPLAITGTNVRYLGASPNVSSSVVIINGKRSSSREVTMVYRYRVLAPKPGSYQVPPITVSQGNKTASTAPASFTALEIADSNEMKLRLGIPERPLWAGETFEATVDLYLRKDPQQPTFSIPLFDQDDKFEIRAPVAAPDEKTLGFAAGAREVELPYKSEPAKLDGTEYTRFRFRALATPRAVGTIKLDPARVVAGLPVGRARDDFGFPITTTSIFKAEDRPRTLEVRPLPLGDRPRGFSGAVGASFAVSTQANRTVVRVGDPIELTVLIRSDTDLTGLSLPPFAALGSHFEKWFDVPQETPAGELGKGGKTKSFRVTLRLKSTDAREIPPFPFSYFDPTSGKYATVHSEPIALSVAGSAVVGAAEVVTTPAHGESGKAAGADSKAGPMALVGADFSLSDDAATLDSARTTGDVLPLLLLLYGAPVVLFGVRVWHLRTRGRREVQSRRRARLRAVQTALADARDRPARESAARISSAFRELARAVDRRDARHPALERLETQAFDPNAAARPLGADLIKELSEVADSWSASPPNVGATGVSSLTLLLLLGGALIGGDKIARAEGSSPDQEVASARAAYQLALGQEERSARRREFSEAERRFRDLASAHPGYPELLTDWGNAALGAGELGWAALAYRRALLLAPGSTRAQRNLTWVRERLPAWANAPPTGGALTSLFFWQRAVSPALLQLIAALCFAIGVLLCIPWSSRGRTALLRRVALAPLLLWLALLTSSFVGRDTAADGVITGDGQVLRSADSVGAAPAFSDPLPAGAEVEVRETRGDWSRVLLANGVEGWVRGSGVERVAAEAQRTQQ
jgi:hypothetical protein